MAKPQRLLVGCATSMARAFRSSRSTVRTWDAPCAGSPSPACSCVPATVESIIKTAPARPAHRSEAYLNITSRWRTGNSLYKRVKCPRLVFPPRHTRRSRHARAQKADRLVRRTAATWGVDPRHHGAPGSAGDRKLVLRLWQRRAHGICIPARNRDSSRHHVCALRQRSLEQPADSKPASHTRMVYSSAAWMGLEFHGGDRFDSHGASLSFWSSQLPPRTDLGCW